MIQVGQGPVALGFHLARIYLIQLGVDGFQFLPVIGMKITAAGDGRDIFERFLIQRLLPGRSRVAYRDRIGDHTIVTRNFCCPFGWYQAAGIITIGEHDQDALIDFKVGYFGTALLALCVLTLGAGVMFQSGREFSGSAGGFANQVIALYTDNLGAWSRPLIGLSALTVMFSTTLTVVDGFPRAIATLVERFQGPEVPDRPSAGSRRIYWGALVVLGIGTIVIATYLLTSLKGLVDVATVLSFLTAPVLAWLNHRAILGAEMPIEHRPRGAMVVYSWAGIVFSLAFALWFLKVRFL